MSGDEDVYLLFRIICGIREDARIDATRNAIYTLDDHAVLIRLEELFIQQAFPLGVEELAAAMSNELVACPLCRA